MYDMMDFNMYEPNGWPGTDCPELTATHPMAPSTPESRWTPPAAAGHYGLGPLHGPSPAEVQHLPPVNHFLPGAGVPADPTEHRRPCTTHSQPGSTQQTPDQLYSCRYDTHHHQTHRSHDQTPSFSWTTPHPCMQPPVSSDSSGPPCRPRPPNGHSGGCLVKTEPSAGDEATCGLAPVTDGYRTPGPVPPAAASPEMGYVPTPCTQTSPVGREPPAGGMQVGREPPASGMQVGREPPAREKKERRREQNRRAARKCRIKKKRIWDGLFKDYASLEESNNDLERRIEQLQREKDDLRDLLRIHEEHCGLQLGT